MARRWHAACGRFKLAIYDRLIKPRRKHVCLALVRDVYTHAVRTTPHLLQCIFAYLQIYPAFARACAHPEAVRLSRSTMIHAWERTASSSGLPPAASGCQAAWLNASCHIGCCLRPWCNTVRHCAPGAKLSRCIYNA